MVFMEILQLHCYAVPELPPSRKPLHKCTNRQIVLNCHKMTTCQLNKQLWKCLHVYIAYMHRYTYATNL